MNYLEILRNVINNGQPKQAVRFDSSGNHIPVENGTIGTFCEIFRHDMSKGFPLSTLRRLPYKSTWVELEGFIKGITAKSWYQNRGCGFWNEWANPIATKEFYKKNYTDHYSESAKQGYIDEDPPAAFGSIEKYIKMSVDDLGPIYGYQWRGFGKHYGSEIKSHTPSSLNSSSGPINGLENGFDQLKNIVDKLKTNPYDRRMVCSSWNPNQLDLMGLPACHYSWTVVVYGNKLNLTWNQRSCDLVLGVPQNITSYATLLLLLCKESGLEPGELVGKLEDCHIYENLFPKALELSEREENELPTVEILSKPDGSFSIFNWEHTDIKLDNYNHQGKMDMGSVTV
jgi:thymidylate synthase